MTGDATTVRPSEAFVGRIEPTRTSFLYQVGLAIVAVTMVLLPLVYVAMIAVVGKLLWWHAVNDGVIFEHLSGRGMILALLVYLGPLVAGGILLLFLVKPLFARGPKPPAPFVLRESEDPELFAFVRRLCQVVGAPVPREIHADSQVNASASFRRGWLSFFGRDLVLTIGAPLVAGMTVRQLAGVLAHEFGHFAQGAGMRLTFVIRSVNFWFARVVYQRDAWDERLDAWATTDDWRLKVVFLLAKGGVWLSRKVLWLLMQAGHAISCFMSRQMEYDADSYEAKVAGSDEFARTSERLRLLAVAANAAMQDAQRAYQRSELPDDLSALVTWHARRIPGEVSAQLDAEREKERTHWAQTHPCERDRLRAASALAAPGVFHLDAPATVLFADWPARARAVTHHFYEHNQALPVHRLQLRPTEALLADCSVEEASGENLVKFFGGTYPLLDLGEIPEATPSEHAEAVAAMQRHAADVPRLIRDAAQTEERLRRQRAGADLARAGFQFADPAAFGLVNDSPAAAAQAVAGTEAVLERSRAEVAVHGDAALRRLAAALAWLGTQPDDTPEAAQRRRQLVELQRAFVAVRAEMECVHHSATGTRLILENASNHPNVPAAERTAREVARRGLASWATIMSRVGSLPHPSTGAARPIREAIQPFTPADNEFTRALKASDACSSALEPLLHRIVGELCGAAFEAEEKMRCVPGGTASEDVQPMQP